jgi:hypothetical protein
MRLLHLRRQRRQLRLWLLLLLMVRRCLQLWLLHVHVLRVVHGMHGWPRSLGAAAACVGLVCVQSRSDCS